MCREKRSLCCMPPRVRPTKSAHWKTPITAEGGRRDAHYLLAQSSYPMMKITSYSLVDW